MRMMDFWILCAIMFIIVECRDKDFKKKNRSQKGAIALSNYGEVNIYRADKIASIPLCRQLDCRENEVCVVSKNISATCMKEKFWVKSMEYKRLQKPAKIFKPASFFTSNNDCPPCPVVHPTFVCGTDNITYSSECRLEYKNCEDNTSVKVACTGKCPCKTEEMTESVTSASTTKTSTVKFLKKHEMRQQGLINGDKDGLDQDNHVSIHKVGKGVAASSSSCSKKELKELRSRLVEWFYTVFRTKVEEGEPADFVQSPVCSHGADHAVLSWMFIYFDTNKDTNLSLRELFDLEADKYEHCINPLLESCDIDGNLDISGQEWCRCFRGKKQAKSRKASRIAYN